LSLTQTGREEFWPFGRKEKNQFEKVDEKQAKNIKLEKRGNEK